MTHVLTPGRWQGLKATATEGEIFTILAFDQRGSYEKMLPKDATYTAAVQIKTEVIRALTPYASAVLLDPLYGLEAMLNRSRNSGLLISLEESGYTGDSTYRGIEFNAQWTVEKIKLAGASAVKLLAYYHPDSGALAEEIEGVIASVIAECRKYDIPLFLEPVTYSLKTEVSKNSAAFAETRPAAVLETARRLARLKPDVLKMEFPVDTAFNSNRDEWKASCEAISEASDVPWVLLSAGVNFEEFEPQVQIACQSGASGFLAGRAIWKEAIPMPVLERKQFIETVAVERMKKLADLASQYARPWTAFYTPTSVSKEWFHEYPAKA